jgi:hypothetical protein
MFQIRNRPVNETSVTLPRHAADRLNQLVDLMPLFHRITGHERPGDAMRHMRSSSTMRNTPRT